MEIIMQAIKSFVTSIKSRGQLTIPKQIRQVGHLEEGQVVSIIPVVDAIIITPKRLELDEARRQIKKILKDTVVSPEEILAGLRDERESLYKETYGKKRS
jgi:AbrB family looped-hinge helix DNA binding protein